MWEELSEHFLQRAEMTAVTQRGQNISAGFTLSNMWRPVGSLMLSLCLDFMWPNLPAVNKSFDSFLGTFFFHNESKKLINDLLHVNKHGLIQESRKVIISCCSCWVCLMLNAIIRLPPQVNMMEACGSETFPQIVILFFLQAQNQCRAAESDLTDVG